MDPSLTQSFEAVKHFHFFVPLAPCEYISLSVKSQVTVLQCNMIDKTTFWQEQGLLDYKREGEEKKTVP